MQSAQSQSALCHLKGGVGDPRIVLTGHTSGACHAGLGGFAVDGNLHGSGRITLAYTAVPGLEGMSTGGQTGDLQLDDAAAVGMIHRHPVHGQIGMAQIQLLQGLIIFTEQIACCTAPVAEGKGDALKFH